MRQDFQRDLRYLWKFFLAKYILFLIHPQGTQGDYFFQGAVACVMSCATKLDSAGTTDGCTFGNTNFADGLQTAPEDNDLFA